MTEMHEIEQPMEFPLIVREAEGFFVAPAGLRVYDRDFAENWAKAYFAARAVLEDESRWLDTSKLPKWVTVNGVFTVNFVTARGRIIETFPRTREGYAALMTAIEKIAKSPCDYYDRWRGVNPKKCGPRTKQKEREFHMESDYKIYYNPRHGLVTAVITANESHKLDRPIQKAFSVKRNGGIQAAKALASAWRKAELQKLR